MKLSEISPEKLDKVICKDKSTLSQLHMKFHFLNLQFSKKIKHQELVFSFPQLTTFVLHIFSLNLLRNIEYTNTC